MSLIGKKSAVISLGSSCQTAFQLGQHAGLLSKAMGDELAWSRLPFDWTTASPADASGWLRGPLRFPQSAEALVPVGIKPAGFLWPEHGVYFWHDFQTPDGVDVAGTFEHTQNMYLRHFRKLKKLGDLDQVVAVVSNTQHNLGDLLPGANLSYRQDDIVRLKAVFERMIGRSCRMLFVTRDDRCTAGVTNLADRDITVVRIADDASSWTGNNETWEKILTDYFAMAD